MLLRGALLQRTGVGDHDATLSAGRLLIAYAIRLQGFFLQPYLGLEILDPNARTRDDLGGAVRGGLNLYFAGVLRLALEVDHQRGQIAFVEPDRTIVTVFLGAYLR